MLWHCEECVRAVRKGRRKVSWVTLVSGPVFAHWLSLHGTSPLRRLSENFAITQQVSSRSHWALTGIGLQATVEMLIKFVLQPRLLHFLIIASRFTVEEMEPSWIWCLLNWMSDHDAPAQASDWGMRQPARAVEVRVLAEPWTSKLIQSSSESLTPLTHQLKVIVVILSIHETWVKISVLDMTLVFFFLNLN